MVRKTKEEAMETRERILNATVDVFHAQGVAKSSLEEIAEAAGVTRGAIYWHFKNKADIFLALHDQLHSPIMQNLTRVLETSTSNPLKDLMDFCVTELLDLESNTRKRQIMTLFTLKCDYSGEMAPLFEEQNKQEKEGLIITQGFFKAAIRQGILPAKSDAQTLALAFFCYICGIFNEFGRNPSLFDLKKQARPLVEHFFKGL